MTSDLFTSISLNTKLIYIFISALKLQTSSNKINAFTYRTTNQIIDNKKSFFLFVLFVRLAVVFGGEILLLFLLFSNNFLAL